jgi:hypothetical protein
MQKEKAERILGTDPKQENQFQFRLEAGQWLKLDY